MKFRENCNFIKINKKPSRPIIYFIIKNDEVVYVGQSKNGLKRAFEHSDIEFDSIGFVECEKEELNYYEDFYIAKYLPLYNKKFNGFLYKKCKDNKIYKKTVSLNGIKYYYHNNDISALTDLYKAVKTNWVYTKLIGPILKKRKKTENFIANCLGLTEIQFLHDIDSYKITNKQLERIAAALNARLDVRFIDNETGQPII